MFIRRTFISKPVASVLLGLTSLSYVITVVAQTAVETGLLLKGTAANSAKPTLNRDSAAAKIPVGAPSRTNVPARNAPQSTAQALSVNPPVPIAAPVLARVERNGPVDVGPDMSLIVGKSTLLRLPDAIERISIGSPAVADVTLISGRELYLIGKTFGTTNVMLWRASGGTTVIDVTVSIDTAALQAQLHALMPNEKRVEVRSAADSLVLSGTVSSALRANEAVEIAEGFLRAYSRGITLPVVAGAPTVGAGQVLATGVTQATASGQNRPKVINMLKIAQPMQVMLEVKVAEVSRTLLDKLGGSLNLSRTNNGWTYSLVSNFLKGGNSGVDASGPNGKSFSFDAEKKDGLVKILAEPSLVAISGQEASFLAGGKIFIPVARSNNLTGTTITLEEKEFGIGLKFMPVVLDNNQIVLKVSPEVSEVTQSGNPFTTANGVTTLLPGFTVRRAQTTVQMLDGQSLAIGGLIKNNIIETVSKMPLLGEIPILGALFRSTEFQNDRSELLFIITPRLMKPLDGEALLPTDSFRPPSRLEFFGNGQLEGSGNVDVPSDRPRAGSASGSGASPKLEMK
jgi:pilus assembly protein CpaC